MEGCIMYSKMTDTHTYRDRAEEKGRESLSQNNWVNVKQKLISSK